ncbi:MAG: STAS domain-containing protein [Nitrospira sp.]|nr:STAS domain-containing protein [Nitrospira sp.]
MNEPSRATPIGDLTIFEIAGFAATLQAGLANGGHAVIDLSHVGTVDAAALQLLIAACESGGAEIVHAPKSLAGQFASLGWNSPMASKVAYVD